MPFGAIGTRTIRQGAAGNYRVASELLLRGFHVYLPAVDIGADMLVDGGVRIQVKSARLMTRPRDVGYQRSYNFFLGRGPKALGGGRTTPSTTRIFSDHCDVVVLWGIDQNRFWIVPAGLLDNRFTICLGTDVRWCNTNVVKLKELRDQGLRLEDIAAQTGLSVMTVSRRLRGQYMELPPSYAINKQIKECENGWELIQQYVETMTQANALTGKLARQECN